MSEQTEPGCAYEGGRMFYRTLPLVFPALWAAGGWVLWQRYGDDALFGVATGCVVLLLGLLAIEFARPARRLKPDPERIGRLVADIAIDRLAYLESAGAAELPLVKELEFLFLPDLSDHESWRAREILSGPVGDQTVVVFDHAPQPAEEDGESGRQTTIVFLDAWRGRPNFVIVPQDGLGSLLRSQGFPVFDARGLPAEDRRAFARFVSHYQLHGFDLGDEDALRQAFPLDTLAFLGEHPAWSIRGHRGHLVLGLSNQTFSGRERVALLAEADALREQLTRPASLGRLVLPGRAETSWVLDWIWVVLLALVVTALAAVLGWVVGGTVGLLAGWFGVAADDWAVVGRNLGVLAGPALARFSLLYDTAREVGRTGEEPAGPSLSEPLPSDVARLRGDVTVLVAPSRPGTPARLRVGDRELWVRVPLLDQVAAER